MATGLVKWCRARFLAGYKPFSVVGGGAEGSDAEELLAGVAAPCSSSPPPPPPPPPPLPLLTPPESPTTPIPTTVNEDQTNSHTTRQLSFEEFECDVSVADGDRKRQEFSFTLYDFDGHGKITKDDIAGLVTTIYDTLGASIQVPPCGSKTIKVKLTVSPDQRSGQAHITPIKTTNLPQSLSAPTPCCHVKHVTSCGHAKHASRRVPRRRRVQRHRCQSEHGVDSPTEDDARNVSAKKLLEEELRRRVGPVPHLPSPYSNSSEGDVSEDSDASPLLTPLTPLVPNQRKRSGAMQRQQLLEIIQANMEKNNLSFHASRKRHQNEHARIPLRSPYTEPSSPYIQRCRQTQAARQPTYHKPVREHHTHHPNSLPDVPTSKPRSNGRKLRAHNSPQQTCATAHTADNYSQANNTISQNLTTSATQNNLNTTTNNQNSNNSHNNHSNNQTTNLHTNNLHNENHIQQPHSNKTGKKHQLKHATREQDQARAMAQVVRWLEREFSQGAAAAAAAGRKHVHEHIHHHYHHYHAEALV